MAEISSYSSRYFGKIEGSIFHAFYLEDSFNIRVFQNRKLSKFNNKLSDYMREIILDYMPETILSTASLLRKLITAYFNN